jgi:hypothetical protein
MNREALEQTVRVLEDVIRYKLNFSLETFVGVNVDYGDGDIENIGLGRYTGGEAKEASDKFYAAMEKEQFLLIPHNCGCTACATGYAGLDPWFRERGFMTEKDGRVMFNDERGWSALTEFYDLDEFAAEYLFMPHENYTTPEDVINRISSVLTEDCFPDPEY